MPGWETLEVVAAPPPNCRAWGKVLSAGTPGVRRAVHVAEGRAGVHPAQAGRGLMCTLFHPAVVEALPRPGGLCPGHWSLSSEALASPGSSLPLGTSCRKFWSCGVPVREAEWQCLWHQ